MCFIQLPNIISITPSDVSLIFHGHRSNLPEIIMKTLHLSHIDQQSSLFLPAIYFY